MNTNALKAAFTLAGYDIKSAGAALGIPPATMYRKVKRGDFTINEASEMIIIFNIKNPMEVFFNEST